MRTLSCTYTVRPILRSVCTGSTVLTLKYCSRRDKYRYKNLMMKVGGLLLIVRTRERVNACMPKYLLLFNLLL